MTVTFRRCLAPSLFLLLVFVGTPAALLARPLDARAGAQLPGLKQALADARLGRELTDEDRVAVQGAFANGNSVLVALAACVLRDGVGEEADLHNLAAKATESATGVGEAFLRFLAVRRSRGGQEALMPLLKDENPYLQVEAAKELCRLSPEEGVRALTELLSSKSAIAHAEAFRQLDRLEMAGDARPYLMPEEQYRLLLSILDEVGREWGPEVGGFRLHGHAEMPAYRVGDPVVVSVTLENVSTQPRAYGVVHKWADYKVSVADAEGRDMPKTEYGRQMEESGMSIFRNFVMRMPPGGQTSVTFHVTRLFDLSKAGTYTVTVVRTRILDGEKTVAVTSNPITVRIRE